MGTFHIEYQRKVWQSTRQMVD